MTIVVFFVGFVWIVGKESKEAQQNDTSCKYLKCLK
jgi:hypothetical protein